MKNWTLLFFFLVFLSCTNQDKKYLFKDKSSDFVLIVPDNSDEIIKAAAQEFSDYIYKCSDTRIEIKSSAKETENKIILGFKSMLEEDLRKKTEELPEDAFIISYNDSDLFIGGNNLKSTRYAIYTFLEDYLGYRYLAPGEEFVPDLDKKELVVFEKIYKPAFSFRRTLFPGLYDEKFRNWHKIEELDDWGMFVHTFQHLIPPETYFEEHPEYFSLIGGNRMQDAQLCLSNPDVIKLLIGNLSKEMAKKPEKNTWSVSQNDCINFCECKNCKALYEKYENISGAYVQMANEIAERFPDKQISTLAYQFTRAAPKNIVPRDNVNIMFCSIECNRSMPLEDDNRSASFVKDMKDWSQLSNNIFLWDYVVQFKNYFTPFPNFHVLQPNIQFFRDHQVNLMFQQGSGGNWSDLSELKQYMISKLLWNPDLDVDELKDDFLTKYYGPAAPYIKEYHELAEAEIIKHQENEFLNIYGFPMDYVDSYLTPVLMEKYRELMDKAEGSVKGDSVYLKRVLRARLPVDFAYLDISLNLGEEKLSFFTEENGEKSLRPEMMNYLDRMVEISEKTNTTRINERNFQTSEYRDYARRKIEMMNKKNLAKDAEFKILTTYSDSYPVGGERALNDGLFGDLDFHNNWLGFQGYDMIVEIDLKEAKSIRKANMNFLKAVNSWVFLPTEVIIEVSNDGKKYRAVGNLHGDISDQNYLVKSIPFNIEFPTENIQYVRVSAKSLKECPSWHRGYGNPSWIFIDEIILE